MKLLFSEVASDYSRYLYPYVVWAIPEPGEAASSIYGAGFHPASPDLDRFALCRHVRVPLVGFEPSSENRRVLRKGEGIEACLVAKTDYADGEGRRREWLAFAEDRFGPGVMTAARLEGLMRGRVVTHLLVFRDAAREGREVGTALMYVEAPAMAHYYYAFYDRGHALRGLGMFMMTAAVRLFRDLGFGHLYLGTCYSERALYKAQFSGLEYFNGIEWSSRLEGLRFQVRRDSRSTHLLQEPGFLAMEGPLEELARRSSFTHGAGGGAVDSGGGGSRVGGG